MKWLRMEPVSYTHLIDVLLFESVTGDYRTPPTSCILQDRLALSENCFCMDIPKMCIRDSFGIANSVSYFLIQNKNNELLTRYYASASYILIAVMVIDVYKRQVYE